MAEALVGYFLANLQDLLLYHVDLLSGVVKDQVESLQIKVNLMNAFLKDSREMRNESEYVKELVRQFTYLTFEAEDIIDSFVVNASTQKARSTWGRKLHVLDHTQMLRNVSEQIRAIELKIKDLLAFNNFRFERLQIGEPARKLANKEKKIPIVEEENVVGFDGEARTIVEGLTKGPEQLEVISVVGMGGLGQTTLAKKVYTDPSIDSHFFYRGWVYVSQQYSRREVFHGILDSMKLMTDEMHKIMDEGLAVELRNRLSGDRYLIVIDDLWTSEAWDDINWAFPETMRGSRILLTSRNTDVAKHANRHNNPHHLRFLNNEESWELLCKKVFPDGSCSSELEESGRDIAKKCYGLPLAIVVVSGLLVKRKERAFWSRVARSVSVHVAKDKQCVNILALSYNHLPEHLKACFIYFGAFPEDFEIPVSILLKLWVAEGFIQPWEHECLEDIAEDYLMELVDRNLVMVAKKRANGRIKSCRIHDMLRDLCVSEGGKEKILQVIMGVQGSTSLSSPIPNYHRRLCVHSQVSEFISSKPSGPHVRTLLCFSADKKDLPREHESVIHEAFKLVRILDLKPITLSRFPGGMVRLVLVRFLSLSGEFKVVPPSISQLWNLQTLIVETKLPNLDIQADIWKMLQFRHLQTSGLSHLQGPRAETRNDGEHHFVSRNIQTICTIVPENCTENILERTPNLRKLGIRGKLVRLVELEERRGVCLFDNLAKLNLLETLKLLNDTYPDAPSLYIMPGLPPPKKFPANLKKMTLSGTLLDWVHISTLGMLPNLEVLKLKQYAFKGDRWEPLDGGFRLLRALYLERSDLVHWNAFSHHFPRLERLVLKLCTSLPMIPSGLANVSTLQNLELYWPTPAAADSAKSIQKQKQQIEKMGNNRSFKLLIYPPQDA